ncbi:hypothetical protein BDP27DRAFT_1316876 [Rhodocollybia butyracea]|uniref:Uncharacterized protein n=1 Tax=Rhodocollybia butyracea TaxID=206335 RepID=A0A9P5Q3D3_9AGAR|nr:hypothetical protein BDP27DRAFT_1316876 [Rhodocollybia butyracea]
MALSNISFGNEDATHLQYASFTNAWFIDGTYDATNTGQSGTLSSTHDNSANVTFVFPRAANAVYYYGIRRCCGGLYAACVDCAPNTPIEGFESIDAVNTTDDGRNPPVVLWSQVFSEPGIHTVILTNQLDNRFNGNSEITLASFALQVQGDSTSSSSPSPSSTSSSSPSTLQPSSSLLSSSTPFPITTISATPTSNLSTSSSNEIPLAPLLGGLLGGLVVLGCVLAAILFYRHRHRYTPSDLNSLAVGPRSYITPFTVSEASTGNEDTTTTYIPSSVLPMKPSYGQGDIIRRQFPMDPRLEARLLQTDSESESERTLPPSYDQLFP